MIKKPVSWFLTERGKGFSFTALTALGIGGSAFKFLPNTFFLYKYKELVHNYSEAQPVPLSKELQNRFEKCMELLNIQETHHKLIKPFSVFGFDLFNAGSIKFKYGAVVGLPVNFTYKTHDDIQKDSIMVNQKPINWESETGKKLADALVLSEEEQIFAICRELLSTTNFKLLLQSIYPFVSVLFAYGISQGLNKKFNLYIYPTSIRAVVYLLVSLFSIGLYFFMEDYTEIKYEVMTDKELCKLGPQFIESGAKFYEKLLLRNQALRELMGSEGENKYSVKGNENYFLRQPRISLVHRKLYFEEKLEELRNEKENEQ